MMEKLLCFARQYDMLPQGQTLLVALSGGMDSMCLLHFLHGRGFSVAAAHYNHRLRGAEADADEAFVRAWCAERGIVCHVGSGDVRAAAQRRGESVEEAARRMRYAFLEETARQYGYARIVTAHHANDNAETVLHHLSRGTGLRGLGGIAPVRGSIVRPMLVITRTEIEAYAAANAVPYRTDSTNADTALTRNYVRAELLPRLTQVNADAVSHMSETALRLRGEDAFLDSLAAAALHEMHTESGAVSVPCAVLAQAHPVLRVRMLRLMLERLGSGRKDFTAAHYDALCALAQGGGSSELSLPSGVCALRSAGVLSLLRSVLPPPPAELREGETVEWGRYRIAFRILSGEAEESFGGLPISCGRIGAALLVDSWRSSDRLRLPDSRGARSLKRLFHDAGIAGTQRQQIPVFRSGETVAAVFGFGTDVSFLPSGGGRVGILSITEIREK